ncbi:MAG: hypothetical protein ACKO3V_08975 [Pirellula sp.]
MMVAPLLKLQTVAAAVVVKDEVAKDVEMVVAALLEMVVVADAVARTKVERTLLMATTTFLGNPLLLAQVNRKRRPLTTVNITGAPAVLDGISLIVRLITLLALVEMLLVVPMVVPTLLDLPLPLVPLPTCKWLKPNMQHGVSCAQFTNACQYTCISLRSGEFSAT